MRTASLLSVLAPVALALLPVAGADITTSGQLAAGQVLGDYWTNYPGFPAHMTNQHLAFTLHDYAADDPCLFHLWQHGYVTVQSMPNTNSPLQSNGGYLAYQGHYGVDPGSASFDVNGISFIGSGSYSVSGSSGANGVAVLYVTLDFSGTSGAGYSFHYHGTSGAYTLVWNQDLAVC